MEIEMIAALLGAFLYFGRFGIFMVQKIIFLSPLSILHRRNCLCVYHSKDKSPDSPTMHFVLVRAMRPCRLNVAIWAYPLRPCLCHLTNFSVIQGHRKYFLHT